MKNAIALLCLVAATAAQTSPELTSDSSGNVFINRQVRTSLADIQTQIQLAVADAQVAAERAAYAATSNATVTMFDRMQGMQATMMAQMNAVTSQMAELDSRLTGQASTLASSLAASNEQATQSMAAAMQATTEELTLSQSNVAATVDNQISTALSNVASSITAMNSTSVATITAGLARKKDSNVHMWTGGCSSTGSEGWREYCLNQAHINTMAPKFRIGTQTRFLTIAAGYYSINWFTTYRTCNWHYMVIVVDGQNRVHGLNRENYHESGNSWRDAHAFLHYPIAANKQFWGKSYVGCWTNWHSTNPRGEHSRITVIYQGTIA